MKKINKLYVFIACAVFCIGLYAIVNKEPVDQDPIKIGQISALSGIGSDIGNEEKKGAELAVEYINGRGGVHGRMIELVSEDVSLDKINSTASAIRKLVSIDEVMAIVGPQWDEPSAIAVPLSQELKTVIVSPNASPQVESEIQSDYFFSTFYSNEVGINVLLQFARDKGYTKIAIIQPANFGFWKYTSDLLKKNAPEFGVEIVSEEYGSDFANTDYKTMIAKTKQSAPDAIFGSYADLQCLFLQQAKNQDVNIPLLSTESAGNKKTLEECADTLEGSLYFSTPVHGVRYEEFENMYIKKYGTKPLSPSAVTAYDAVLVLAEAINNSDTLDGTYIKDELTKMTFSKGLSMPMIQFDKRGFVQTDEETFVIKGVEDKEFAVVE